MKNWGPIWRVLNKAPPHLLLQRSYHCSAPKNRMKRSRAPSRALASFINNKSRLWIRSEMKGQKRKINDLSCVNRKTSHTKREWWPYENGCYENMFDRQLKTRKKIVARKIWKKKIGADFAQKCVVPKCLQRLIISNWKFFVVPS